MGAQLSKLAELIAKEEGFGVLGSTPNRRNNPGDLRHAPHASHDGIDPNAIGIEPTAEIGWQDLEHQLGLYAKRGLTLREMVTVYAPPSENATDRYLNAICDGLGMTPETLVSDALTI